MATSPLPLSLENVDAADRTMCPEKDNFARSTLYLKDVKNSVWNLPNNLILSKVNNNNNNNNNSTNANGNGNDSEIISNLFAHCKGAVRRYSRLENANTNCNDVNDNRNNGSGATPAANTVSMDYFVLTK